jgi:hypothetical protein
MKMDTKKPYPMACKSMIVSFTVWLHFVMQVDNNILHHMATFHLDKIDLSKLMLDNGNNIDLLESVHARMGSAFLDGGISRFFSRYLCPGCSFLSARQKNGCPWQKKH